MLHILRYLICFIATSAAIAQSSKPVFDPMNPPKEVVAKPPVAAPVKPAPLPARVAAPATPTQVVATPVSGQPTTVAAIAAKPAPVAAIPVPAAAVPAAPVKPVGPMVVPFDQLEGHVGKMVSIKTNLRTTRKGTLKRFNRAGIVIEDTSRGYAMSIDIPRSTVVEVTVQN